MDNQNQILDDQFNSHSDIDTQRVMSMNKFIFLSIISLGLYEIWWMYKAWKFYQQKEKLDILPGARALFSIFFMHSLYSKILTSAKSKGFEENYNPTFLFIMFFVLNFSSRLPYPYSFISIFSFIFMLQPFRAFNYYIQQLPEVQIEVETKLSNRQAILVVIGTLLWILSIIGLIYAPESY
jgi:hypothetical protein